MFSGNIMFSFHEADASSEYHKHSVIFLVAIKQTSNYWQIDLTMLKKGRPQSLSCIQFQIAVFVKGKYEDFWIIFK